MERSNPSTSPCPSHNSETPQCRRQEGKGRYSQPYLLKNPHFGSGSLPPLQMSRKAAKDSDQLGGLPWAAAWCLALSSSLGPAWCLALGSNCFPGRDRRPEVGNVISGVGSAGCSRDPPTNRFLNATATPPEHKAVSLH